jgi:AcrR family transcriptional regulator
MPIEVRREQVLDAALKLIADHGYGAVTMDAIAREADIAKPVVYNCFPGRRALLHALLDREERRGLEVLAEAMPPNALAKPAAEVLIEWIRNMANAIAAEPPSWRLILLPPDGTPEEVRERVHAGRAFALAQAQALIAGLFGERAGAGLDPELLSHSLFAVCENGARLLLEDPDRYPPERLIAYAESAVRTLGLR